MIATTSTIIIILIEYGRPKCFSFSFFVVWWMPNYRIWIVIGEEKDGRKKGINKKTVPLATTIIKFFYSFLSSSLWLSSEKMTLSILFSFCYSDDDDDDVVWIAWSIIKMLNNWPKKKQRETIKRGWWFWIRLNDFFTQTPKRWRDLNTSLMFE